MVKTREERVAAMAARMKATFEHASTEAFWQHAVAQAVLEVLRRDKDISLSSLTDQIRSHGAGRARLPLGDGNTFDMGDRIAEVAIEKLAKARDGEKADDTGR